MHSKYIVNEALPGNFNLTISEDVTIKRGFTVKDAQKSGYT